MYTATAHLLHAHARSPSISGLQVCRAGPIASCSWLIGSRCAWLTLQAFPGVRELVLKGLELNPRDMLHLGGLSTLATLRLLGCSLEHSASMLALAALTQVQGG